MKIVQIRSFSWSVFSRIRPNTGKYGPEKSPYLDTFHAVLFMLSDLDIDECTLGLHECSTNATCVNAPGFYTCHCNIGYTGNGKTCTSKYPCMIYFELTINPRTCFSTKSEIDFIDSQYEKSLYIGRWHHSPEKYPI